MKLAGALGLVLGLFDGFAASMVGLSGFVFFGMVLQVYRRCRKNEKQAPLPFGPFLAIGAAIIYFIKVGGMIL